MSRTKWATEGPSGVSVESSYPAVERRHNDRRSTFSSGIAGDIPEALIDTVLLGKTMVKLGKALLKNAPRHSH